MYSLKAKINNNNLNNFVSFLNVLQSVPKRVAKLVITPGDVIRDWLQFAWGKSPLFGSKILGW